MKEYIEREAAINTINKLRICLRERGAYDYDLGAAEAKLRVEEIPAADVRPVVRGEWEEEDSASNRWSFRCSVCGKGGRGYKFNYCPNCGADMRGEQDV